MAQHSRLLASSHRGRIFTCGHCDALHHDFGMVSTRLELPTFAHFHDLVAKLDVKAMLEEDCLVFGEPRVRLLLSPSMVALALTEEESYDLRELLHHAALSLQQAQDYEQSDQAGMAELFDEIEHWLHEAPLND